MECVRGEEGENAMSFVHWQTSSFFKEIKGGNAQLCLDSGVLARTCRERHPSMSYYLQEVRVSNDLEVWAWAPARMGKRVGRGLGGGSGHRSTLDLVILRCLSDIQAAVWRRWLVTSLEMSVKLLSAPNPPFSACSVTMELSPVNIFILLSGMILSVLSREHWQDAATTQKGFFSWFRWAFLNGHLPCACHLQSSVPAVDDSQCQHLAGSGTRYPLTDGFLQGRFVQLCHCLHSTADILVSPGNNFPIFLQPPNLITHCSGWRVRGREKTPCFLGRRKWAYQNK